MNIILFYSRDGVLHMRAFIVWARVDQLVQSSEDTIQTGLLLLLLFFFCGVLAATYLKYCKHHISVVLAIRLAPSLHCGTHTRARTHTHARTHARAHTHTHTLSLSHTHTHTHTHKSRIQNLYLVLWHDWQQQPSTLAKKIETGT